jgi:mxaK protein
MKRRTVHFGFAALALMVGTLAGGSAWQWQHARQRNAAIAMAGQSNAPLDEQPAPESQLARALVLARQGSSDAAIIAYKALTLNERKDIQQAALYNLGNLYLREALKDGATEAVRYVPLIELAKQSFRTLLRMNSSDWEARYNLEQALRLAPEADEVAAENGESTGPKERAITTMQSHQLVLP